MNNKVLSRTKLQKVIVELQNYSPKKTIVLCHGVFDLVHPGHLEHFRQAKNFGDLLIVSITADVFINKGPNRPYFDQIRRAQFLSALEIVDYVYISNSDSAIDSIELIKPNFYAKGADYRILTDDITGKIEIEKDSVEKWGGKIVFTDGFTSSSTKLINNAVLPQDSEVRIWVNDLKEKYSLKYIFEWIEKLSTVEVNVLGETILDFYTDCSPLAKSSKDPILAFQRLKTNKFLGGVLAISHSCSRWSEKTFMISTCGQDFKSHLSEIKTEISFEYEFVTLHDRPTIVKHRFVDVNSGNRVFEYYDYNPEPLEKSLQDLIIENLTHKLRKNSLLLLADYGHGFFGDYLIDKLSKSEAFLAVNTQANAGNSGFNTFSKYPRIDFLSLNGGELELELRSKNLDYYKVVPEIMVSKGCRNAVVTLGGNGLLTFDSTGDVARTPALASKVIDKVGAGDSVLAIASMLSFLGAPKEIIGLLSSIVAAFEVSQLGHKESMSIVDMKRYLNGLFG